MGIVDKVKDKAKEYMGSDKEKENKRSEHQHQRSQNSESDENQNIDKLKNKFDKNS